MKRKASIFWVVFLPIQLFILHLLQRFPAQVELLYSEGLYPKIALLSRTLLGWIPFSVGDILYILAILCIARWVFIVFKSRFKKATSRLIQLLATFSIGYFLFHVLWGFNYYREPLHKKLNIGTDYKTEELIQLTHQLVLNTNRLQIEIAKNDSTKVDFNYSLHEIYKKSALAYQQLEIDFPNFTYPKKSVKNSLLSTPLTYMGFNGYLNPFTNEAQINTKIPLFKLPSTTTHEIAHQLGIAKESEANFLACLTTLKHTDIRFRYAGNAFALQYCLGELYARDKCSFENLVAQLHPGVKKNYQEVSVFWETHQNMLEPFFKLFYDNFLKTNNQPQGIKSYNYVVALLVNYAHKNPKHFS